MVPQAIKEISGVDKTLFQQEILTGYRPLVIRGLVSEWPLIKVGKESPQALADYLGRFDAGTTLEAFIGDPDINGRFFYKDDLKSFNFQRKPGSFSTIIQRLLAAVNEERPSSIYMGSTPIPVAFPGLLPQLINPVLDSRIPPNIWLGNRSFIAPHYDLSDNLACVVSGQRRFTLFPPEQIANLYVGPIDNTPAGQPTSLVDIRDPDFAKYPRYRSALAAAQTAVLEPGDAIYIPSLWWHGVEALGPLNVLLNYWWEPEHVLEGSPFESLIHAILTIRNMPKERRLAWREIFDFYIFEADEENLAHLPPETRGALGPLTPELARYLKHCLIRAMTRA